MATPVSSQRTSAGFIYVLKPQVLVNGQEVIKIGMTTRSVAQRVRELTTGSMVPFEVVFSLHVENARQLEKQLHARYRSQRLVGGGQEFFHVSSKEVVGEIERIATEISRVRARGARNGEMATFQMQIGATRVENLINFPMIILFLPCWFIGVWVINKEAHQIMGYSQAALITLLATFILPIFFGWCCGRLKRYLRSRYFEPRFGLAIAAKHQELRQKYPLAYD